MLKAVVFVEGEEDARFLRHYLKRLRYAVVAQPRKGGSEPAKANKTIAVTELDGVNEKSLFSKKAKEKITPILGETNTALFVLDANGSFAKKTNLFNKYKAEIAKSSPPLPAPPAKMELFLMPNNKDAGVLEDLLKKLTTPKSPVFACMERYKKCLRENGVKKTPNIKAEIYAYCDAHNLFANGKANYAKAQYWNLQSPALTPLKNFLTKGLGAP
jgi:hypothetical protein